MQGNSQSFLRKTAMSVNLEIVAHGFGSQCCQVRESCFWFGDYLQRFDTMVYSLIFLLLAKRLDY